MTLQNIKLCQVLTNAQINIYHLIQLVLRMHHAHGAHDLIFKKLTLQTNNQNLRHFYMKPINWVCHFPFYKNGEFECKIHLEHWNVKQIISSQ